MNEAQNLQDATLLNGVNPAQEPQSQEPLLPQHKVNTLVGAAKQKGYEKGYQEALSTLPQQQQATQPQAGMNPDDIRRIAQETFIQQQQAQQQKMEEQARTQHGMKILNELGVKFNDAKTRLPDFDNVVNLQDFVQSPEVLHYVNGVDNSGDVLYDLSKNPGKLAQLVALSKNGLHNHASVAVKQMSDAIKQNQMGLQQAGTPEPLNQIKPSNIGLGNGSGKNATVSDLRNDPRYRG